MDAITPKAEANSNGQKVVSRPYQNKHVTISVIVPTLNEEKNLPQLFSAIPNMVDEIVLVDGRSTDRTVEVARELSPDIRVVNQTGKGKGNALRAGFEAATSDIIVMLDADGSTDPTEIHNFVGALKAGADFAKGSRFMQGAGTSDMEFHRYLGNQFFVWTVRILFGGRYTDLCYGYNAFWKRTLPLLNLDGDGFEIETMMNVRALQAGLRIAEVPSFENRRFTGTSNLNAIKDGLRVLRTIFQEWVGKPRVRTPKMHEASVTVKAFRETFNSLMEDIISLSQMRDTLPEQNFENAKLSLMARFDELMDQNLDSPACESLQRRYRKYYRPVINKYLG